MQNAVNWNDLSRFGKLRAVIDPNDGMGFKNMLIDRVHWLAIRRQLNGAENLLDIGCGTGRFARRIQNMGIRYTGVDTSGGMIRAAQEWNAGDEKSFSHIDGTKLPFADGTFDAVLVSRVIMHVLKDAQCWPLLKEIKRVLIPGGRLVLLEEASLSGKKSGQAPCSLTEKDYLDALAPDFHVNVIRKVRSSEFSKLGRRWTEWKDLSYPVFRLILPVLAWFEEKRARNFQDSYYTKVTYYEFLIGAKRK